ncbi:MAG TPA: CoB--CoM heterodisulfide reductase iron-sulfur subunit B family protein [Nitrospirae bacterium]|nr:CoB--CoM heterodisulfide reductase iron-sulfur subunit B family protein [Nitrospirota bacterium]
MKQVGLFLGCNIPFNRPDVEYSARYILSELETNAVDLEGASCCPAFGTMPSIDIEAWAAASAWNLVLADEKGIDLVTGCGSCYGSLNEAKHHMGQHPELIEKINQIYAKVGKEYKGTAKVSNFINFIYEDVGLEKIKQKVKVNLNGLKCAVQTGCHNLWPSEAYPTSEDNTFQPKRLREICEAMGGSAPNYSAITDCCGMGALRSNASDKSLALFKKKLDMIKEELDPDICVIGCSSCLMQFDAGQALLIEQKKLNYQIPSLHIIQLIALALGADIDKLTAFTKVPLDGAINKIKGGN